MTDILQVSSDPKEQIEEAFYRYKRARRAYRRMAQKPTRKYRRKVKRFKRYTFQKRTYSYRGDKRRFKQGRYKKRKHGSKWFKGHFLSKEEQDAFMARRKKIFDKRKPRHNDSKAPNFLTSGKGTGRRHNPIDKVTGKPLTCHKCGADWHLQRECPGKGGKSSAMMTSTEPGHWDGYGMVSSDGPEQGTYTAHAESASRGPLHGLFQREDADDTTCEPCLALLSSNWHSDHTYGMMIQTSEEDTGESNRSADTTSNSNTGTTESEQPQDDWANRYSLVGDIPRMRQTME